MECSVQCSENHAYDWSFKLYTPSCKNLVEAASFSEGRVPKTIVRPTIHQEAEGGNSPNVS